jgi:hypothetical protein
MEHCDLFSRASCNWRWRKWRRSEGSQESVGFRSFFLCKKSFKAQVTKDDRKDNTKAASV